MSRGCGGCSLVAASAPQGHPISQSWESVDDSSDEELFNRFCVKDHKSDMDVLCGRIQKKVSFRTPRENAFQELAERKVPHRQWRCKEHFRQWEMVQVFQVKFDYEDGSFPVKDTGGCKSCSGQWLPDGLACPYHQLASRESQLYELWRRWDHRIDSINPIEWQDAEGHEDYPSDSGLVPGAADFVKFLGLD